MKSKYIFMMTTAVVILLFGCKSKEKVTTTAFHSYTTECMGKNMDGSQTLRVWASGRNRTDAIEQAKKKAVYDVVFTGISAGSGECNAYPVVDEANARKKHEDYFDKFFADGGAFKKYATTKNQKKSSMKSYQGDGSQTWEIIVNVNRSALRNRLVKDNIIVK